MNSTVEHLGVNTSNADMKGGDRDGVQEEITDLLEVCLLKDELRKAASLVSYYNAAEGATWSNEKQDRASAKIRFANAALACRRLGIDTAPILKGYLS